jgi:hypothetical protein
MSHIGVFDASSVVREDHTVHSIHQNSPLIFLLRGLLMVMCQV